MPGRFRRIFLLLDLWSSLPPQPCCVNFPLNFFSFFIQAYSLLKYEAAKTLRAAVLLLRCLVSTGSPSRCLLRNISSSPPCNAVHKGSAKSLFQVANAEARGLWGESVLLAVYPKIHGAGCTIPQDFLLHVQKKCLY